MVSKRGSAPDREEALRLAREIVEAFEHASEHGAAADVLTWRLARALLALAANLEAAERERDAMEQRSEKYRHLRAREAEVKWEQHDRAERAERDLASAREALERIRDWRNFRHTGEVRDAADAALRSLGEKA